LSQADKKEYRFDDNGGAIDTVPEREEFVPRFFFHVRGIHQELSRDELGLDVPDVETAYLMTYSAARDLRRVFVSRSQNLRDYTIEVTTAADELVFELPFSVIFDHEVVRRPFLAS
jgi:uncharacterized protein DUF6894